MNEKPVNIHFIIPSTNRIKKGESLNILVGIHNDNITTIKYTFRIFADKGNGFNEIFSQTRILEPGQNPHHYFNLPASCFLNGSDESEIEEILIASSESGDNCEVIFID